jgi:hypothetical protein
MPISAKLTSCAGTDEAERDARYSILLTFSTVGAPVWAGAFEKPLTDMFQTHRTDVTACNVD